MAIKKSKKLLAGEPSEGGVLSIVSKTKFKKMLENFWKHCEKNLEKNFNKNLENIFKKVWKNI